MKILSNEIFAQNLRNIRKKSGLSQEEVIAKLELMGSPLSRSTYSLIELGRNNIFASDLMGLQKIFNVPFEEFFKGISVER